MMSSDKKRGGRRWLPYVAGIVLVALIVIGLWPRPVPVEVASAAVGRLRVMVSEEGRTRVLQKYIVSSPVAGQLRRIPFKAGASVVAGETVLAGIDPVTPALLDPRARARAEAGRDAASAAVAKAQANLAFATGELKRFQSLIEQGAVSPQEFDSVKLREAASSRDLASAESALRQAEAELAEFTQRSSGGRVLEIKAPVSGRVLRVLEENARTVMPGMPLLELGDPADLEVVVDVLSRDGAVIVPGARVELDHWGGGKPLEGKVRLVEPAAFTKVSALGVEEQRVNVIIDLLTPPEQRTTVGDGFRVEARIIVWEEEKVLKVAAGALFRTRQDWSCFVVENGRAVLRSIKAGRSSGVETQVLEGLKEGESVILYPGGRVKPGQRVKIIAI
jgi:HlyD family secretion protein